MRYIEGAKLSFIHDFGTQNLASGWLGNRCSEGIGGRGSGFGGGGHWVWVGRRDSLLPIVSLLPDALIVMNATDDWTVFDGRTGSIGC